jgi:hypothetical protein
MVFQEPYMNITIEDMPDVQWYIHMIGADIPCSIAAINLWLISVVKT